MSKFIKRIEKNNFQKKTCGIRYIYISIRWGTCIQIKKNEIQLQKRKLPNLFELKDPPVRGSRKKSNKRQRLDHTHLVWSFENCDSASPLWNIYQQSHMTASTIIQHILWIGSTGWVTQLSTHMWSLIPSV